MGFYSLLQRFKGAWLSSLILQELATDNQQIELDPKSLVNLQAILEAQLSWSQERLLAIADESTQTQIAWCDEALNFVRPIASDYSFTCSEIILCFLPLILYHHDSWQDLAGLLRQQGKSLQKSSEAIDNILVWCYALRLALRGELSGHNFRDTLVRGIELETKSVILWLKDIETIYLRGYSGEQLLQKLSNTEDREIPLSLFCFFSNSEDWLLTIQQALHLEKRVTNCVCLSGILSGAYNGSIAIPLHWRNFCQDRNFYRYIVDRVEKMNARWLGIEVKENANSLSAIVTAPKILQPRQQLKIVSQQEYT